MLTSDCFFPIPEQNFFSLLIQECLEDGSKLCLDLHTQLSGRTLSDYEVGAFWDPLLHEE